jgi:hypothetical protein
VLREGPGGGGNRGGNKRRDVDEWKERWWEREIIVRLCVRLMKSRWMNTLRLHIAVAHRDTTSKGAWFTVAMVVGLSILFSL